jgi:DNA-binding transcriptional LysR family regulator
VSILEVAMTFDLELRSGVPAISGDWNSLDNFDVSKSLDALAARRIAVTLNQLSFLAAVARRRNLTKASLDLRVSQPSVSQQLKQLEEHYGTKLYRRVSKGVEITEAGQSLLRMIIPILEQVARLEAGFKKAGARSVPQVLTVGGTYSASSVLLPRLLARLGKQHPGADLEFRTGTSDELERLVLSSLLDLAVIDRKSSKDLKSEPLRSERAVVFVPAGHRLASRGKVSLLDLLAEPLIIRGGKGIAGTSERTFRYLRQQGLPVNIALRCDAPAAVKSAVRQGMGVGVAFEDVIKDEIESGEFKAIDVPGLRLGAKSFVVYPKDRPLSSLAREFLLLLREARDEVLQRKPKAMVAVRENPAARPESDDNPPAKPPPYPPQEAWQSRTARENISTSDTATLSPSSFLGFLLQSSALGFQMWL